VSITTSYTKPVLIGGAIMGVLSALPIVSACCCLWVISGGVVAAYLLQQQEPGPITAADGATVGLFAGLAGAVVSLVVSIPFNLLMAPLRQQAIDQVIRNGQMPPELQRFLTSYAAGALSLVAWFVFMLMVGAVFSTLGGLLGAAIFRKKTPPGVIDIPPPPVS
jgi:hypothetical protein